MPSFDISSEVDMVALKNAVDVCARQIATRYDFKGTSAAVELNEKDKVITLFGDSDFQLDQVKAILLPAMEKKEADSAKRLDHQAVQKISGNKVKQELKIRAGIDSELAKKLGNSVEALPYTVMIDEKGNVIKQKVGKLNEKDLKSWISEVR